MNKRQKLIQAQFLNNEEAVIRRLKSIYTQSQKDIEKKTQALQDEINRLGTLAKLSVDEEEKAQLLSMQQSKIYQKQYQDAMKKQIGSILDNMQVEEFKTVSEYLQKCYEDGFIGTMYDLQGQGIPLCFPMDQEAMVRAVQIDSKISNGLYSRLGEDVALLKKKITAQVSRGIATGMSFQQVAQQLSGITNIGFNNAVRIARTEGHRLQVQSAMDACHKAKDKGADVVKQWDSTLDSRTRESHQAVDGEIRELDEKFSNGLMFPGDPSGGAAEVVNCRCALLQRARWALDEDELETLKERAAYFGLDKSKNFDDYKKKYLDATAEPKYSVLQKLNYSGRVTPELEANLEKSLTKIPPKHRELAESRISGIEITDSQTGSSYSIKTGKIKISQNADPDDIIHEYAHALAESLGSYKDQKFKEIMVKGLENVSPLDVIYDEESFVESIYRVECDKFISKYQGRLYEEVGIFSGKGVSLDGMLDYFSEGYAEYIRNPNNLKTHDPDLFDYFEGIT